MDCVQIIRLSHHLTLLAARFFEQDIQRAADHLLLDLTLVTRDQSLDALQARVAFGGVDLGRSAAYVPGRVEYLKE